MLMEDTHSLLAIIFRCSCLLGMLACAAHISSLKASGAAVDSPLRAIDMVFWFRFLVSTGKLAVSTKEYRYQSVLTDNFL